MNGFVTRVTMFSACSVFTVSAIPGFAQSNTVLDRRPSYSSTSVVNLYDAGVSARYDDVTLPPNLTVTSLYRDVIHSMLDRSAVFRRQCARIASADRRLTIEVESASATPSRRAPAWTRIRRHDGRIHAVISVTMNGRTPELIAHEFEHVIEQLDGIDLPAKSRVSASGVRQCDCGDFEAFETTRAIHMGLKVAREVAGRSP